MTQILKAIDCGEAKAAGELLPLVYDELRKLARHRMSGEAADHTLQPTALVHEAYLRLVGKDNPGWQNRAHFFAAAAEAMRRILVDHARRKQADKRGGDLERQPLDSAQLVAPSPGNDIVALDEALGRLKRIEPQAAQVVELKYFAGLSLQEIAQMLGISPRTADRQWAYARAWLHQELRGAGTQ
ncbi:MAG TPA: sigma-70 family RNA polymerase sigma factor [Tepidisphaeraceae bacterium]|nr:sigma-70 family RNA polymerase sigma factor [Tepidisphaeraceae bacterium]